MIEEVKRLEDWLAFSDVAALLHVSKQAVHKMVWDNDEFDVDDIRAVGVRTFLLRTSAVKSKIAARQQARLRSASEQRRVAPSVIR